MIITGLVETDSSDPTNIVKKTDYNGYVVFIK